MTDMSLPIIKNPVKSYKMVYCDIDDTLIMWDTSQYKDLHTLIINYGGEDTYLKINQKNVNLLIKLYKLGYSIVAWSQTGYDWAELVCKELYIDKYISLYLSKPRYHIDDLPSTVWMGERIYRDPITGK